MINGGLIHIKTTIFIIKLKVKKHTHIYPYLWNMGCIIKFETKSKHVESVVGGTGTAKGSIYENSMA